MNHSARPSHHVARKTLACLFALLVVFSSRAYAQEEAHVFVDSTAQVIRGFGAANIVGWRPDMTSDEIETAFGTGEGQLGFSLLRVRIPPQENQWNVNLPSAQAAHAMGATIIASPWSPPASMKTNNNLVSGRLRDDRYDDYAAYLDAFNTYMQENGVPLYALSVQNEPDVEVTYESCDWTGEQMRRFLAEHASAINTRVIAPESFQFRRSMSDPILNDPAALANLDIVGGHIYGGGLRPYPLAEEKGKEVWMTEHLDLEIDLEAALGTASDIQEVMKSGMSAYIWWYIVRFYGPISDGEEGGYEKGEVTKRGYMMAQFSRFIRPGYVRVHTDEDISNVSVTAYKDDSRLVIVALNDASTSKEVQFTLDGGREGLFSRYVTSATQNVEPLDEVAVSGNTFTAVLGPNSVTTFVSDDRVVSSEAGALPPTAYQLRPNYPNPFHAATTISYTVPRTSDITLEVFDVLGRKVATLAEGTVAAGSHQVAFDASHLPAGVYVCQLRAGDAVVTQRMTLMK